MQATGFNTIQNYIDLKLIPETTRDAIVLIPFKIT